MLGGTFMAMVAQRAKRMLVKQRNVTQETILTDEV